MRLTSARLLESVIRAKEGEEGREPSEQSTVRAGHAGWPCGLAAKLGVIELMLGSPSRTSTGSVPARVPHSLLLPALVWI
jgi:hypothetical protein